MSKRWGTNSGWLWVGEVREVWGLCSAHWSKWGVVGVARRSRDREALKTQQTGGEQGREGRGATFLGLFCFQNPDAKK